MTRKQSLLPTVLIPLVAGIALTPKVANGQIVPDDTLGEESSTVRQDNIKGIDSDIIEGGATRGANLFHSFEEFNVEAGRGAYFANPDAIANILSRVTGSNSSQILGTLGVLGDANLFLINPNGIVFGENARLDVGGSFFAATADSLLFDNGFEFSSSDPQAPPLLTVNIPVGLGFRDNPGSIENRSVATALNNNTVGFQVQPGNSLALVGGEVNLDGGTLTAEGGRVELGGVSAAGIVELNIDGSLSFPDDVTRADVSLTNGARVNVSAGGGGSITINARNLEVREGSELFAGIAENMGSPNAVAGDITINATDSVRLIGNPRQASPEDREASIIERDNATGIRNNVGLSSVRRNDGSSRSNALGNGGSINVETGNLELINVAVLDTSIFGEGDGGNITINADSVSLNQGSIRTQVKGVDLEIVKEKANGDAGYLSITTNSLSLDDRAFIGADVQQRATGNGGDIKISSGSLEAQSDSQILADIKGKGNAGNITIDVANTASFDNTLILSQVQKGAVGNGGDIKISSGSLEAQSDSLILADTQGEGNAGNITIDVANTASFDNTLILSQVQKGAVGNGGDINITANNIDLTNNSQILANTKAGNGGNVIIQASDNFTLSGDSFILTQLGRDSRGSAGNIDITAGSLDFNQRNRLPHLQSDAQPGSRGDAGDITIDVDKTASFDNTLILSQVQEDAVGNGGDIKISANNIDLINNSQVLADTKGKGNAGELNITATETILLDDNSLILSEVGKEGEGKAGNIDINAASIIVDNFSGISSSTRRGGKGNAGSITINSNNLRIANGAIVDAFTENQFDGGNIIINTDILDIVAGGKIVTATDSEGKAGNIDLKDTETIDIDGNNAPARPAEFPKPDVAILNQLERQTGLFANTAPDSKGDGGKVTIETGQLLVSDGAQISASTSGSGKGGEFDHPRSSGSGIWRHWIEKL